jgi:hypothetical protein
MWNEIGPKKIRQYLRVYLIRFDLGFGNPPHLCWICQYQLIQPIMRVISVSLHDMIYFYWYRQLWPAYSA